MQQLYAKIKKSSMYYEQNEIAKRDGYRLSDVNLYIKDENGEVRIN